MFFAVSKIVWCLIAPLNFLILLQVVGLIYLWRKRQRVGIWLISISTFCLLAVAVFPVADRLLQPLEQWIPAPTRLPEKIDGIVLLAGGQNPRLTQAYGRPILGGTAQTMTTFVALARQYPNAKLVFSGGSGDLIRGTTSEADVARLFLVEQGIDPARLIAEDRSRNTYENAIFTREIVQPRSGQTWILVTRAYHMPRATWVFLRSGWETVPYPIAFAAPPSGWSLGPPEAARSFAKLHTAVHEWIGLGVYWLTGRI